MSAIGFEVDFLAISPCGSVLLDFLALGRISLGETDMKKLIAGTAFVGALFASSAAFAACTTDVKKDDLTQDQVNGLYECIKDKLREGYASKDAPLTKDYQGWKDAATGPAATGTHGKRFLMTFANDTAYDEYVKYSDERGPMPVGSILAKESFNVSKKGKIKKGPVFFMTKVAASDAKEYGNWIYAAVTPKGKVMKVKQGFCHGCHGAFEDQDSMGYPGEEVRISSN